MTHDEFRTRIDDVFRRSPLVPAVLELAVGGRVVVDVPEQVETKPGMVNVSRRDAPTVYRIGYEEIVRITPLDELLGENGGMSYAEFYATVRPLLWQEPYQPFALEFRDGRKLVIDRPGRLALAGRFGVFLPPGAAPLVRFTYDQVTRVVTATPLGQADHAA